MLMLQTRIAQDVQTRIEIFFNAGLVWI